LELFVLDWRDLFENLFVYSFNVGCMMTYLFELPKSIIEILIKYFTLFLKFDKKFYLACNPDLNTVGINPIRHFVNHGFKEKRIFSLDECTIVPVNELELAQFQDLFNSPIQGMISKSFRLSIVLLPWTTGCWGRPFRFLRVKISNALINTDIFKENSQIVYTKKGVRHGVFLVKC
jgi:hypothetical protein